MAVQADSSGRYVEPPRSLLIFGASAHIGGPLAERVRDTSPSTVLRLATSDSAKVAALQAQFPKSEVVVANYFDLPSLLAAFAGIEGLFVITPDFTEEVVAMDNVVAAARHVKSIRHIVRITGDPPHVHSEHDVPKRLTARNGTAVQHLRARDVLTASGLPVTYLNIAAYIMDTVVRVLGDGVRRKRTIFMPFDRHMAYVDPADVGRAAAVTLLSGDTFHLGKTYHLSNGVDCITFAELAALMSEVFGEPVAHSGSLDDFKSFSGERLARKYGPEALDYFVDLLRWEQTQDTIWRRTDVFEAVFGLQPRTLAAWLNDNKAAFLRAA